MPTIFTCSVTLTPREHSTLDRIVQILNSIRAREIVRKKPAVKRELWGGEFWTDGYYVATVGERGNWETEEKYVHGHSYPKAALRQLTLFD